MVLAPAMSTIYDTPDRADVHRGGRLVTTEGVPLPLQSAHLAVDAWGGLTRSVLTQTFVNETDHVLKVQYLLPLPSDGAVSGFSFTIGNERVVGEVDTKKQARQRFDQALIEGRTAAIVDQVRSSLFEQEVGNIPPGETVVAEIIVDQPLKWLEEGAWEWRFPTVVGPRYMGQPGRVQDAGRMTADVSEQELSVRMGLDLQIRDDLRDDGAPESPSHSLKVQERGRIFVTFAEGGARLNRDVVVRWSVAALKPGMSLDVTRPAADALNGDAFGLLTLVPPSPAAAFEPVARDLVVLVDVSGSMGGEPLEQAKRVVSAVVDTMTDRDRIELIKFSNRPERFKREPIAVTRDGKRAAMKWIKSLRAGGCTEMRDAIIEALKPLRGDTQRQILLVTDGYIGFEQEIVEEVRRSLPKASRLHTIGVGSSVNRTLTQGAARAGAGLEIVIAPGEDPERAAQRLVTRTDRPVVTELSVEGDAVFETAPVHAPDLFARCPTQIMLRLSGKGGEVVIRGKTADGDLVQRLSYPGLTLGEGPGQVAARFARERVEDLEMLRAGGGDARDVNAQVERIGLDFQIATRLTSWVAVSETIRVKPGRQSHTVRQPHEAPQDVSLEGVGLRAPASPAAYGRGAGAARTQSGVVLPRPMARARRSAAKKAAPAEFEMPSLELFDDSDDTDGFGELSKLSAEPMMNARLSEDFDFEDESLAEADSVSSVLGLDSEEIPAFGASGEAYAGDDELTQSGVIPPGQAPMTLAGPPPPSFAPPAPARRSSSAKKAAFRAEADWGRADPEPVEQDKAEVDLAIESLVELSSTEGGLGGDLPSGSLAPQAPSEPSLVPASKTQGTPQRALLDVKPGQAPKAVMRGRPVWANPIVLGILVVLAILLGWWLSGLSTPSDAGRPTPAGQEAPAVEKTSEANAPQN